MDAELMALKRAVQAALLEAEDLSAWDAERIRVLGKAGRLTAMLKALGAMPAQERRAHGKALNRLRDELETMFATRKEALMQAALARRLLSERVDVTLPLPRAATGKLHPLTRSIEEMIEIFVTMGFSVAEGPDIETQWHNFAALNTPEHHPARTEHDTFYLPSSELDVAPSVLRTQTSGVQIRSMLKQNPPIRIIAPGRTYRADHDATHSPMFHQCEGLCIARGINLAHLKGCLITFLRNFFGKPDLPVRFRASYFPFTEPSLEVDIGWSRRSGNIGGGEDWLEVLGAGMVHPRVLANCGIDPAEWQGFAFGMGIERLTMLKHGIADLRAFYDGDARWIRYFGASPFEGASGAMRGI